MLQKELESRVVTPAPMETVPPAKRIALDPEVNTVTRTNDMEADGNVSRLLSGQVPLFQNFKFPETGVTESHPQPSERNRLPKNVIIFIFLNTINGLQDYFRFDFAAYSEMYNWATVLILNM